MKLFRKAFLAILLLSTCVGAADDRYKDLQTKFICLCGCNFGPLNMCTMINCGHAVPMRAELKDMIDQNKTDEQITAAFVQKYGSWVLSAPPMKGFNITAWVMPFVALILGALVVGFIVKSRKERAAVATAPGPVDMKYQDQLEEELKKFTPED